MRLRAEWGAIDRENDLGRVKFDEAVDQGHAHRFEQMTRAIVGFLRDSDHRGRWWANLPQSPGDHGTDRLPGVSVAPLFGQEPVGHLRPAAPVGPRYHRNQAKDGPVRTVDYDEVAGHMLEAAHAARYLIGGDRAAQVPANRWVGSQP